MVGTISSISSGGVVTLTSAIANPVNVGDMIVCGALITLVFTAPLPCALPTGAPLTISGLTTAAGFNTGIFNGAQTVESSTPSSVSFWVTGAYVPQIASLGTASVSWSGFGLYSGYLTATAGVGFTRAVRYAGQASTAIYAGEKHGVGIVTIFNAQSEHAVMFSTGANNGIPASINQVYNTDGDNAFAAVAQPALPSIDNGRQQRERRHVCAAPMHPGNYGTDGITAYNNKIIALTSLPVMVLNVSLSGHGQSTSISIAGP